MTDKNAYDALYFSRGRGRGHAIPDLAIIRELRSMCPDVRIIFVSYGTGRDVFATAGEPVMDLRLPDTASFVDLLVPCGKLLRKMLPPVIISHEEPAVLPVAKIFGLSTVFMIHWFTAHYEPSMQALVHADEILFMEKEGIFPEPESAKGRVQYIGPVLRRFEFRPADRERVRGEMGIYPDQKVILMLHGTPAERMEPTRDLVLDAFHKLDFSHKKLIWVAGKDSEEIKHYSATSNEIEVLGFYPQLDRLMVACDVAITKGTYCTGKELEALGIPSISLSYGKNFIDDHFARSVQSNTFLWAEETDASKLANCITQSLERGLAAPNYEDLDGRGAVSLATSLARIIARARNSPSDV